MTDQAVQERPESEPAASTPAGDQQLVSAGADKPMTRTGAMGFGLAPRNFDEAWRMAGILANSSLVPKNYQENPSDILVAMQYGAEIGLPPMASLQSVAVINGKPGVYGDGFLGVIQSTPTYAKHREYYVLATGDQVASLRQADYANDDTQAVSMFWRKGNPEPFIGTFSIGDAKRAQLWGKSGPWSTAPARMLLWRARGYAGRNGFSAELRGIKTAEELLDTPPEAIDDAPLTAPPAEPLRRSEKTASAPAAPDPGVIDVDPSPDAGAALPADASQAAPETTAAAAPSTKAKPKGIFSQTQPGQVAKHVRIDNTCVIDAATYGTPVYEISGIAGEGKAGMGAKWLTTDQELYRAAASCEGSDAHFDVTWAAAKATAGKFANKPVKVITGLQAAD